MDYDRAQLALILQGYIAAVEEITRLRRQIEALRSARDTAAVSPVKK